MHGSLQDQARGRYVWSSQHRHEVYKEKDITHTTRPCCERLLVQTLSDSFLSIYLDRAEQGIEALAVWWITIEHFYYLASTLLDIQSEGHWSDRKKKRFNCLYSASLASIRGPSITNYDSCHSVLEHILFALLPLDYPVNQWMSMTRDACFSP